MSDPKTCPRCTTILLVLFCVGCSGGQSTPDEAPAETPGEGSTAADATDDATKAPASNCPIDGAEEVEIQLPTSTGEALMVDGLDHDRLWNNDLNGDGMPDMILQQRGACNANDECTVTVWLGCTPNTFTAVWGPDFAYELYVLEETHEHAGTTWTTLERAMSDGDRGMVRTLLYFNGTEYAPAQ